MYLLNQISKESSKDEYVFTFHYVSIKSPFQLYGRDIRYQFTFHYVSIKSKIPCVVPVVSFLFTFHYVSIKSQSSRRGCIFVSYLHSTMYLLNQWSQQGCRGADYYLHSTMYLLNQIDKPDKVRVERNLHSTMYLLNRYQPQYKVWWDQFTFHYVSIKSNTSANIK